MESIKSTPLLEIHRNLGARIIEFVGFYMPLQYSGVVDEHRTVRQSVGLFDVSHMGQVELRGEHALEAAHYLVPNNVLGLDDGQVLYTPICYPDGGIVDDCLVYRFTANHVLIVINAANIDKDIRWISDRIGDRCKVKNKSDTYALIAIQGPFAREVSSSLFGPQVLELAPFTFARYSVGDMDCVVSRTGYTGEDGFEIACSPEYAPRLWRELSEAGQDKGLKPCGLGARDTLRLEAKLCLYGNDIDRTTSPLEAGLGWTVKLKAGDFIGREAIKKQKKEGIKRKLVCLVMRSRGIARQGHPICLLNEDETMGEPIGQVTSGTKSPTLGEAIALGYVSKPQSKIGTSLAVNVRGKMVRAEVIQGPFYKRAQL